MGIRSDAREIVHVRESASGNMVYGRDDGRNIKEEQWISLLSWGVTNRRVPYACLPYLWSMMDYLPTSRSIYSLQLMSRDSMRSGAKGTRVATYTEIPPEEKGG